VLGMVVALVTRQKDQVGIQVLHIAHIAFTIAPVPVAAAGKCGQHNFFFVHRVLSDQAFIHGFLSVPEPVSHIFGIVPVLNTEES